MPSFLARSAGAAEQCGGDRRGGGRRGGAGRGGPRGAVRLAPAARPRAADHVAHQLGQGAQQRRLGRPGGAVAHAPRACVQAAGSVIAKQHEDLLYEHWDFAKTGRVMPDRLRLTPWDSVFSWSCCTA